MLDHLVSGIRLAMTASTSLAILRRSVASLVKSSRCRQPANAFAILGFREQLFELCPEVFHLSEPHAAARRVRKLIV
jgi:hypothetical protein